LQVPPRLHGTKPSRHKSPAARGRPRKESMTVVLLVALVLLAAVAVVSSLRKRAARQEAAAALARTRAARRSRVPNVSNNLKGVTATQTIEPYGTGRSAASDEDEQAA